MKILLTGGQGQLGRAFQRIAPRGWLLVAPPREELDLADPDSIREAVLHHAPDWVVNAGAYTDVERAEIEPELANRVNGEAPQALAKALRQTGGRLLQISTDYVFDGAHQRPYYPAARPNPLSAYGRSKALGERNLGEGALIVRTGWLYGPDRSNFVLTILRMMREGRPLKVVSDQTGSPTHADSLATCLMKLMLQGSSGIHHYCDQGETSWFSFALAIGQFARAAGLISGLPEITPVTSKQYNARATRPEYSVLDCSETYAAIGYQPAEWRENLKRMLMEAGIEGCRG